MRFDKSYHKAEWLFTVGSHEAFDLIQFVWLSRITHAVPVKTLHAFKRKCFSRFNMNLACDPDAVSQWL